MTGDEWSDYVVELLIRKSHGRLTARQVRESLPADLGANLATLDTFIGQLPEDEGDDLLEHAAMVALGEYPPIPNLYDSTFYEQSTHFLGELAAGATILDTLRSSKQADTPSDHGTADQPQTSIVARPHVHWFVNGRCQCGEIHRPSTVLEGIVGSESPDLER